MDGDEAGGRRTERGPFWWKVPAHSAGGTTPEPPGRTGTGPPVTAVTSDGAVRRKQGGTVEPLFALHP